MLARSEMIVVFVLDESISLGSWISSIDGNFDPKGNYGNKFESATEKSSNGNIRGGPGKPHMRDTQIW